MESGRILCNVNLVMLVTLIYYLLFQVWDIKYQDDFATYSLLQNGFDVVS